MSGLLESDNHVKSPDMFDEDPKLCVVPPGYVNDVTPSIHIGNRSKVSYGYYVQRIPPNPLSNPPESEHLVIWLVPISRSEELVPK